MGKLGHFGVESPTFPPPLGVVPSRRPGDHLSHQPRRKMHGRWDLGWTFMKVLPLVGVSLSLSLKLYEENMWVLNMCISIGYIFIVICTLISKSKNVYIIYTLYIYIPTCIALLPYLPQHWPTRQAGWIIFWSKKDAIPIPSMGLVSVYSPTSTIQINQS